MQYSVTNVLACFIVIVFTKEGSKFQLALQFPGFNSGIFRMRFRNTVYRYARGRYAARCI